MSFLKDFKEIKGDASFRKFYRNKNKNKNSIIVLAEKERNKNLLIYDAWISRNYNWSSLFNG